MKILISGLIALAMGTASAASLEGQYIRPNDELHDDYTSNAILTWFVETWKENGFDMPTDGVPFRWSDYLDPVPDKKGAQWDLIRYMDDGSPKVALVLEADSGDGKIVIKSPIGPGMSLMTAVESKDVVGYLRPHKAAPKPTPSKYKPNEI